MYTSDGLHVGGQFLTHIPTNCPGDSQEQTHPSPADSGLHHYSQLHSGVPSPVRCCWAADTSPQDVPGDAPHLRQDCPRAQRRGRAGNLPPGALPSSPYLCTFGPQQACCPVAPAVQSCPPGTLGGFRIRNSLRYIGELAHCALIPWTAHSATMQKPTHHITATATATHT